MIKENLSKVLKEIPENVKLVAVSKTKPNNDILEAYNAGQRIFGENKVQELVGKAESLPDDIKWHMIGHLQTNKVKYIAPFVDLIHGVDSLKLLKAINKEAIKNNRKISCLLQFHIAEEDSKFGFSIKEAEELLNSEMFKGFTHVIVCGVMGMATFTKDENQIKNEFKKLHEIFNRLKSTYFNSNDNFKEISMGMSSDYQLGIAEGSTMVRIGSLIFGERVYH